MIPLVDAPIREINAIEGAECCSLEDIPTEDIPTEPNVSPITRA